MDNVIPFPVPMAFAAAPSTVAHGPGAPLAPPAPVVPFPERGARAAPGWAWVVFWIVLALQALLGTALASALSRAAGRADATPEEVVLTGD